MVSKPIPPIKVYLPEHCPDELMEKAPSRDDMDWVAHVPPEYWEWSKSVGLEDMTPGFIERMDTCSRPDRVDLPDKSTLYFAYHA